MLIPRDDIGGVALLCAFQILLVKQRAPLYEIVVMTASHHLYHAGELNQVLSIYRGEAWEETEEVEENNISTMGHRVKPPWLDGQGE